MGRISDPPLRALAKTWTPVVFEVLDELGKRIWPPVKERPGLLGKPIVITRYSLEGPVQHGDEIVWALSHTSKPSTFDAQGNLTEGERLFWLVHLRTGRALVFRIEGRMIVDGVLANQRDLRDALKQAEPYPIVETFYGNKGPLRHP